jgi:hypothetical protein
MQKYPLQSLLLLIRMADEDAVLAEEDAALRILLSPLVLTVVGNEWWK